MLGTVLVAAERVLTTSNYVLHAIKIYCARWRARFEASGSLGSIRLVLLVMITAATDQILHSVFVRLSSEQQHVEKNQ